MSTKSPTSTANKKRYERFADYLQFEHGLSVSSINCYVVHIERFKAWHDKNGSRGAKPWSQVDESDVRDFILATKPSAAYGGLIIASLGRFFRFQRDILKERADDPTTLIARPKQVRGSPSVLEPHEIEILMSYTLKHSPKSVQLRNWSLIGFLYGSGVRISEACDLTVQQLYYEDELPYAINVVGKGGKERTVVLNDTAKVALHKWLRHRQGIVLKLPANASKLHIWIIPTGSYVGQVLKPSSVRKMLKGLGEKALGKSVHPHMFRHSFITQAVRGGAPLHAIQAAAGHVDLSTTGRYMHANVDDIATVAASVRDVLRSSS